MASKITGRILVVDDEKSMREFLEILLHKEGYEVYTASNGLNALDVLKKKNVDVILTDLKMPYLNGIELLEAVKKEYPEIEVIVFTAYSTVETAIEAMKKGAFNYVQKPFKLDELKLTLKKCLERKQLIDENIKLKKELLQKTEYKMEGFIFKSQAMERIFELVKTVAPTRSSVLITGESGTGKEVVARAIHKLSKRRNKPFIPIDCGAIPENLLESELFGHTKGAFTGAVINKKGLFQMANGGTVFLDEIAELPLHLQVKLLRVLQERKVRPVGELHEIPIDVRIIAATNKNIEEYIAEGKFREDLYYRLNVIPIHIPPLRERKEDIPHLSYYFLKKFRVEFEKEVKWIDEEAMNLLMEYHYPGNVRELENIIERAVNFSKGDFITPENLPDFVRNKSSSKTNGFLEDKLEIPESGFNLDKHLEEIEKAYLIKALKRTGGNKTLAAKLLGISFRSIRYKIDKHKINI